MTGEQMYNLMNSLFPINRSLTGTGVRQTLDILRDWIPLEIRSVSSGEKIWDWEIPDEWEITEGYIETMKGKRVIDFKNNNLHVIGYSVAVNKVISKKELESNVFYLRSQPDAIPYITSYYKREWGFCLTYNQWKKMRDEDYKVVIKSRHFKGVMNYADVILPGRLNTEILISTYICHPSMASNELSGPIIAVALYNYLASLKSRKYTYRFVFAPETIGSLVYLKENLKYLKENVKLGFVLTCLGDDDNYSAILTPDENTLGDQLAKKIVESYGNKGRLFTFRERGSDERQFLFPSIDIPVITLTRTKFYEFPEYHTSLDNMSIVTPEGLENSLKYVLEYIVELEKNSYFLVNTNGEPFLSKRELYPTISSKSSNDEVRNMMDVLFLSNGQRSTQHISGMLGLSVPEVLEIIGTLTKHNLVIER